MPRTIRSVLVVLLVVCLVGSSTLVLFGQEETTQEEATGEPESVELANLKQAMEEYQKQLEELVQTVRNMEERLDEAINSSRDNSDNLQNLRERLNSVEGSLSEVSAEAESNKEYLQGLPDVSQFEDKMVQLTRELSTISQRVDNNVSELSQTDQELSQLRSSVNNLENQVSSLRGQGSEVTQFDINRLERRIQSLERERMGGGMSSSQTRLAIGVGAVIIGLFAFAFLS